MPASPQPNIFDRLTKTSVPDISRLPDDALLTRNQICALTGFSDEAVRKWPKQGRGPATIYIEGRPRTTVRAYREWIAGAQRAAS